jgi:hypothetical protein
MLGWLEWRWLGVFIAPTTNSTVGEGCCRWAHQTVRCAIGHCLVRQPRHPTVRVLVVSTVGALTSWGTRQSRVAPDRHCSLSGAPSGATLTLCELSAHCSRALFTFADDRWRSSRCSSWRTEQSGATPNSPVNYSGAASEKPKAEEFGVYGPRCIIHCPMVHQTLSGGTPDSPVAHRTVRCARPGHTSVSFAPFF